MAAKSTGIGWASGVGRSGAILAPIVIGLLVSQALPLQQNFLAIAVPGLIAMVAVGLMRPLEPVHAQRSVEATQADVA